MAKYVVKVPATMEQSNYELHCSDDIMSVAAEALFMYNTNRAHDDLLPIRRMPNGTTYWRQYEYIIQGDYGYGDGYEDLTSENTRAEALAQIKLYRSEEPMLPFKIVKHGM